MWIPILLDHRGCHVNSFPTGAFLFKWIRSFSTSARSTLSFSQWYPFHLPKLPLFSCPLTLFVQGLRFLNQVSILLMWSLSILFHQYSYPVILMKSLTEIQVHHSSFFSFSGGLNSSFHVDHILFLVSNAFPMTGAPHKHSTLAILFFRSAQDISKIRVSTLLSFKLFRGCYLIQAF